MHPFSFSPWWNSINVGSGPGKDSSKAYGCRNCAGAHTTLGPHRRNKRPFLTPPPPPTHTNTNTNSAAPSAPVYSPGLSRSRYTLRTLLRSQRCKQGVRHQVQTARAGRVGEKPYDTVVLDVCTRTSETKPLAALGRSNRLDRRDTKPRSAVRVVGEGVGASCPNSYRCRGVLVGSQRCRVSGFRRHLHPARTRSNSGSTKHYGNARTGHGCVTHFARNSKRLAPRAAVLPVEEPPPKTAHLSA